MKKNIDKKKRILILMSKTGNGHLSVAETLKEYFEYVDPDKYEVKIVDALQDHSKRIVKNISKSYVPVVKYLPTLYTSGFYFTDNEIRLSLLLSLIRLQSRKKVTTLIDTFQPNLIISVHPLVNKIAGEISKKKNIPFGVLITDMYNVHESWFNRDADLYIAPNTYVAKQCKKHGIQNVKAFPIPVKLKFSRPLDLDKIRRKYKLDKDKHTILFTFGGGGTVNPAKILKELIKKDPNKYQIIVNNGKNTKTYKDIEKIKIKSKMKIVNLGFINNMEEIMNISDIAVCKAGATTVQELFSTTVVPIIINYVRGQEKDCADFVKLKRAGIVSKRKVVEIIENITKNPKRLERYKRNEEKLSDKESGLKSIKEFIKLIK
jgi:UDP-N-acetylglucosamine:LPS N-acetylglucosamine transferase